MPKVKAKVLAIDEKQLLVKLQFNQRTPKVGDMVTCKWGKSRSGAQNSLYWLYLSFLWQDCNLKDEYNTVEELHETLKATFLSKRVFHGSMEFIKVGSTTELDKLAFGEYLKQIDNAMTEYHHIDTHSFWADYEANKSGEVSMELTDEGKAAQARGEF